MTGVITKIMKVVMHIQEQLRRLREQLHTDYGKDYTQIMGVIMQITGGVIEITEMIMEIKGVIPWITGMILEITGVIKEIMGMITKLTGVITEIMIMITVMITQIPRVVTQFTGRIQIREVIAAFVGTIIGCDYGDYGSD